MKILSGMLVSFVAGSMLFAADFSSKSNDELVSLAGSVSKEDIASYVSEIENRIVKMNEKEAIEFRNKIQSQEQQAVSKMSDAQKAQYKQDIDKALRDRNAAQKGDTKAKNTTNKGANNKSTNKLN